MNLNEVKERARHVARFRHLSYRTEKTYLHWITRYSRWCVKHRDGSHADKLRRYLTHLAVDRKVSKATQQQALNALVFLYKQVLGIEIGEIGGAFGASTVEIKANFAGDDYLSIKCRKYPDLKQNFAAVIERARLLKQAYAALPE